MKEYLSDVGELRGICETIRITAIERQNFEIVSANLINTSLSWILEKQQQYSGDVYLEKIENNAVYLNEACWACLEVATEYLCDGNPLVPQDQIDAFVRSIRQNAFEPSAFHQKFIRIGCSACAAHTTHNRYSTLFQLRRNATEAVYLEEIEFQCIWYQMKFILVQDFLKVFLLNHQMAGIALYLSKEEVTAVLSERVQLAVELLGNLTIFSLDGKPQGVTKKTWRKLWEKEIELLLQNKQSVNKK